MPQRIFFAKNGFQVGDHKGKKPEIYHLPTTHTKVPHFHKETTRFPTNGYFFVSK
jgi:hypothetical protein